MCFQLCCGWEGGAGDTKCVRCKLTCRFESVVRVSVLEIIDWQAISGGVVSMTLIGAMVPQCKLELKIKCWICCVAWMERCASSVWHVLGEHTLQFGPQHGMESPILSGNMKSCHLVCHHWFARIRSFETIGQKITERQHAEETQLKSEMQQPIS